MSVLQMAMRNDGSQSLMTMSGWLSAEPDDDCHADLLVLRGFLDESLGRVPPPDEVVVCLEGLESRARDIAERFKAQLISATLPLDRTLQNDVWCLIGALQDLANILQQAANRFGDDDERRLEAVIQSGAHALRLLGDAFVLGCMRGSDVAPGLWQQVFAVMKLMLSVEPDADSVPKADLTAADMQIKRILAISALHPEGLTARELSWIYDYLELVANRAEIRREVIQPESIAFWMDSSGDLAPVSCTRRSAPNGRELLYFSALGIARRIGEQIEWLDKRIAEAEVVGLDRDDELLDPDTSGLPLGLTPVEVVSLLARLRENWTTPPSREHARRPRLYAVQVCLGLGSIWAIHRGMKPKSGIAEWHVCNESPNGYGIISVANLEGELSAGMVLALRRDASERWTICLVRWIRSHENDQIELGLQLVSIACLPVSIGFRGGELRSTVPALMVPPLPGTRTNMAILAPAGTYTSRRFVIVRDGPPLYVAQGRVLGLDLQTASVELFQYEIETFPL